MKKIALKKLVALLDTTLAVGTFDDVSNNGLQVENDGTVTRVMTGVDASLRLLEAAAEAGADCVVCHHGISWGDSLKRITELNYRVISFAVRHNIAIYGAHLPLDAHPVYGNNAQLCQALGVERLKAAFTYHGVRIGFIGALPKAVAMDAFAERVRGKVAEHAQVLAFGKGRVRRVGVVSGGASDMAGQAAALGADVFVTGEPGLVGYNLAEQLGMNVVFAGHYATEVFGVRALAGLIQERLGVPAVFKDFGIAF